MTLPHLLQVLTGLTVILLLIQGGKVIAGADADDRIRQIAGRERSK